MSFEMFPVRSSQIESIGFDKTTNKLRIRFRGKDGPESGPLYEYDDRSEAEYKAFMKAASKYKFFAAIIKPTKAYRKVA